jgi:hypothetical protein
MNIMVEMFHIFNMNYYYIYLHVNKIYMFLFPT